MQEVQVHLVCGSTGAGKTTYADALAVRLRGLRFSIDDWMETLFWPDLPQRNDPSWAMARIDRCMCQIRALIADLVSLGIPCVVDAGFTSRAERAEFARWAKARGMRARLHSVEADPRTRWQRVQRRNAERGPGYAFEVTRKMFDYVETLWEPPDDAEIAALDGVRVTEDGAGC